MLKRCVICGAEFEPHPHNRSVCYADHHHPCPVCGVDVICNDPKRQSCTCSRKCGQQLGDAARVATMQSRYGVNNPSELIEVRDDISRKLKALYPKQPEQYKACEVCGKEFALHWPYTQHTCSPKCRGIYRKQAGIARSVYSKASQTNLSRRGVRNVMQSREIHVKLAANRAKLRADNGETVASKYEQLFYNFCLRNNLDIVTQVPVPIDVNGKHHFTYVDFMVNGRLFECKGGHLIDGCHSDADVPTCSKLALYFVNSVAVITDADLGLAALSHIDNAPIGIDIDIFKEHPNPSIDDMTLWDRLLNCIDRHVSMIYYSTLTDDYIQ